MYETGLIGIKKVFVTLAFLSSTVLISDDLIKALSVSIYKR